MTAEQLIYWLEINTPNDEIRGQIIDLLLGIVIEEELLKNEKNQTFIVEMSLERFKLIRDKHPK